MRDAHDQPDAAEHPEEARAGAPRVRAHRIPEVIVKSDGLGPGGVMQAAAASVKERMRTAVLELGGALAGAIEQLPRPVRRAADLEKALGFQPPLAWRVFRLSQASDVSGAVEYLPTMKQLERVAARLGKEVPEDAARRVTAAVELMAAMMDEVAGDQAAFESLASGLSASGVRRVELAHRRYAFRGNSHVWGLRARCLAACAIERPGTTPETRDGVAVRGLLDLQALRVGVPLQVQARLRVSDVGTPGAPTWKSDLTLLRDYGGPRLPEMDTVQTPEGWLETHIRLPGVGKADAVSLFLHQSFRGAGDDHAPGLGMLVEVPAEWLHLDLIVPQGWTSPGSAYVHSYGSRHDVRRAYVRRPEDRLPLHEPVQEFRARDNVPGTPHVPQWPDVIRHVLKAEGWWGTKFDVYRCVIPFPVLHAWTGLHVDRA